MTFFYLVSWCDICDEQKISLLKFHLCLIRSLLIKLN